MPGLEAGGFALVFVVSVAVTAFALPRIIHRVKQRGLVGKDMNKVGKPEVAEMGGIAVAFGFLCAVMAAFALNSYSGFFAGLNLTSMFAASSTIVIIGFIGLVDDLLGWKHGIKQWQKTLMPLVAALPLMVMPESIAATQMVLPLLGKVNLGILYSLVLVPVAVTGASNAMNMLAGFNGLEAGIGTMIGITALAIALLKDDPSLEAALLLLALLGALLVFLRFNWFPARVFPGDTLTLMMGASFAAVAIVGDMEKILLGLFALYFVELVFKARHAFKSECFGIPQEDGTLLPDPNGGSLTQWVMRRGRFTEKGVVLRILGLQGIVCGAVFALFWFRLF